MRNIKPRTKHKIHQSPKMPAATRREQLLQAAETLFKKQGYRATTTEQIARQAGLTKGALYFHFAHKEDIIFELVKRVVTAHLEALGNITEKNLNPGDFLRIIHKVSQEKNIPSIRYNLDVRAQIQKLPRVQRYLKRAMARGIEIFTQHLHPAYRGDRHYRRQLALLIHCLYDGLMTQKMLNPRIIDVEQQIKLFDSFFVKNKS